MISNDTFITPPTIQYGLKQFPPSIQQLHGINTSPVPSRLNVQQLNSINPSPVPSRLNVQCSLAQITLFIC